MIESSWFSGPPGLHKSLLSNLMTWVTPYSWKGQALVVTEQKHLWILRMFVLKTLPNLPTSRVHFPTFPSRPRWVFPNGTFYCGKFRCLDLQNCTFPHAGATSNWLQGDQSPDGNIIRIWKQIVWFGFLSFTGFTAFWYWPEPRYNKPFGKGVWVFKNGNQLTGDYVQKAAGCEFIKWIKSERFVYVFVGRVNKNRDDMTRQKNEINSWCFWKSTWIVWSSLIPLISVHRSPEVPWLCHIFAQLGDQEQQAEDEPPADDLEVACGHDVNFWCGVWGVKNQNCKLEMLHVWRYCKLLYSKKKWPKWVQQWHEPQGAVRPDPKASFGGTWNFETSFGVSGAGSFCFLFLSLVLGGHCQEFAGDPLR